MPADGGTVSGGAAFLYLQAEALFRQTGQRGVFETLDALKKSNVIIDSETLELIRVFG